jgi:CRP/FNR family transcriptional regulator
MNTQRPEMTIASPARACHGCSVRTSCLARGLDGEALNRFEALRNPIRVIGRGQHLYRAGDPFDMLYVVRSGTLKVSIAAEDGEEQITGFHFPGEITGLDGIDTQHYRSSAVALETASICAFPYRRFAALCKEFPALQESAWQQMSQEISSGQQLLLTMGRKDAEARLATFLLTVSERLKRLGYSATEFRLAMARQEIGDYLGLTLETVSRVFTRFQQAGLLRRDRRFVKIVDLNALRARCVRAAEPLLLRHAS